VPVPIAWQSALRRTGVVVLALVALAAVHIPGRPSTLCLLRAGTGVPCPFCGGTTAGVELGRGDVLAAVRASPLAVAAALGFALDPFGLPSLGRYRWLVVGLIALAAELWQLQRFGFL
jgi:hypothetical protein